MSKEHQAELSLEKNYKARTAAAILVPSAFIFFGLVWIVYGPTPCDMKHHQDSGADIELFDCIADAEKIEAAKFGDVRSNGSQKFP